MVDDVLRPPSLRGRVVLLVAVLAVLLVATSLVALLGQLRADEAADDVTDQALPALVAVERLERAFVDQQTGVRGYVLTGQDAVLEPYRAAGAVIAEQATVLRTSLPGDRAVAEQLDAVLAAHAAWSSTAAEPAIVLRAEGRQAELDELVAASPGVPLFAALRAEVADLRAIIERRVATDAAEAESMRSVLTAVLVIAVLAAVAGVAFVVVGMQRSVTRPLTTLVDAVEQVAGGDLDHRVPTAGPPEFGVLGRAVDRMRLMLNEQRRSAVAEAELREVDRMAIGLREGVIRRLFGISTALTALTNRHPALSGELGQVVGELDRAIGDVRAAATGVPAPGAPAPGAAERPGR